MNDQYHDVKVKSCDNKGADPLPYMENKRLDIWTHNKAIQKSVESYRVTSEHKEYLKSLKIKKG